ncbi:MAG: hypothetical protein KGY80_04585 [Candidatus Thorarchaeota archaeon]|nr:hypothetical protein [Candidatus Thorarchaeota archaeon]
MKRDDTNWLLKDKLVCDFRGFPIGRVKRVWYDEEHGPLVIIERPSTNNNSMSWETIPLRSVHSIKQEVRLKPPKFAE